MPEGKIIDNLTQEAVVVESLGGGFALWAKSEACQWSTALEEIIETSSFYLEGGRF